MTAYNPTGTVFHTAYDLPAAGAPATAASVNDQALKYLGDNTQYLYNLTLPLSAGGNFTPAAPIVLGGLSAGLQIPSGVLTTYFATVGGGISNGGDLFNSGGGQFGGTLFAAALDARFQVASRFDGGGIATIEKRTIHLGASLPGSDTTWFIDPFGESNGDWVLVVLGSVTNTIQVTCSDGALVTLSPGGNHWAFCVRMNTGGGNHWTVLMRGNTP